MASTAGLELAVFLGGIWAAGKGMLDASTFVNDLRETIVLGVRQGERLTLAHRRVLRVDWLLTMIGTVSFPIIYASLLYVLAVRLKSDLPGDLHAIMFAICFVPLLGSALFITCGIYDWRLISETLRAAAITFDTLASGEQSGLSLTDGTVRHDERADHSSNVISQPKGVETS